ncbi:hypothetical protein L6452_44233 [Arctium lappa]|uniref:Uncharacterized protein n=1 Tax=Arctium lappa TaxID=4217 RepID=A0ACB8XGY3_ARCLA|nr:hypothetical protein L6452_44233 [Arctium lappa]
MSVVLLWLYGHECFLSRIKVARSCCSLVCDRSLFGRWQVWKSCPETGAFGTFDSRRGRDFQKQEHGRCCSSGVKSGSSVLFLIAIFGITGYVSCSRKRVVGRMGSSMFVPWSS